MEYQAMKMSASQTDQTLKENEICAHILSDKTFLL